MIKVLVYLDNCVLSDIVHRDRESLLLWKKLTSQPTKYRTLASAYVEKEATQGTNRRFSAARRRLLSQMRILPASSACALLAYRLREELGWNTTRIMDSLHIAAASLHAVEFLITWDKGMLGKNELDARVWLQTNHLHAPTILTPTNFLTRSNPPRWASGPGRDTLGVRESRKFRRQLAIDSGGDQDIALWLLNQGSRKRKQRRS